MQQTSETNVADDNVTSLADHQRQCGERADTIIGLALQLRAAIRSAPVNLPLPDEELDGLQHALAAFINASRIRTMTSQELQEHIRSLEAKCRDERRRDLDNSWTRDPPRHRALYRELLQARAEILLHAQAELNSRRARDGGQSKP
jgi:hypothetical protein